MSHYKPRIIRYSLVLEEFDIERRRKGTKNFVAKHSSRRTIRIHSKMNTSQRF